MASSRQRVSIPRIALLLALLIAPASVRGQAVVGRVLDNQTNDGIRAADVQLLSVDSVVRARAVSDSAGWFRLVAPIPGKYRVLLSVIGYQTLIQPIDLAEAVELEVEVRMATAAIPLEPIKVIARNPYALGNLAGYYSRAEWVRRTGLGRVYMRDDVEKMRLTEVTNLIRMVPARVGCPLTYMINGIVVPLRDIDSLITPDRVEGIEFYTSWMQVPGEYFRRDRCGLVMIWARSDPPADARHYSWLRFLLTGAGAAVLFFLFTR